ncbi:MAG: hypothetical protein EP343_16580 [Deltaproteobacteria bacterium]|nr:MAG: hypothetical protein EP343_16580 [Deltaproteobacteria bacterium]
MRWFPTSLFLVVLMLGLPWSCSQPNPGVEVQSEPTQTTDANGKESSQEEEKATPEEVLKEETPEKPGKTCFLKQKFEEGQRPNYEKFNPTFGSHCVGTNHQDIKGVEQVVFVGDSITAGTPPTDPKQFYRNTTTEALKAKFGDNLIIKDCSKWGARTDDLLLDPHKQLKTCLPNDVEPKKTLIIMTMGGNDLQSIAKDNQKGVSMDKLMAKAEKAVSLLRDAIVWAKDPKRFPNGSYVIFGNIYEYTDGTGDVKSCPASKAVGLDQPWPEGRPILIALNEGFMKIAVDTKSDMIFLLEEFCGHGFHNEDPKTECYYPGAEQWFDFTCTHPNPTGHDQITRMVMSVVNE